MFSPSSMILKVYQKTLFDRLFGCRHIWAYALGDKPGVLTGEPRPICFRRACMKCECRQEIAYFSFVYTHANGQQYMAEPNWVTEEEPVAKLNLNWPDPPKQNANSR